MGIFKKKTETRPDVSEVGIDLVRLRMAEIRGRLAGAKLQAQALLGTEFGDLQGEEPAQDAESRNGKSG